MPFLRPALVVAAASVLGGAAGCGPGAPAPPDDGALPAAVETTVVGGAAATYGGAPDAVLPSTEGPVSLASLAGRPVVVYVDGRGGAGRSALDDVRADLEASGAVVVSVVAEDAPADALEALGYRGAPLCVVLDGEGAVRARLAPTSGDAVFAAAAAVLAEYDLAQTVAWPGADTVEDLVRAGGVVVDLGAASAPAYALRVGADSLSAETLPADLGTPLAFVGPEARAAAERAVGWGYAAVYAVDAGGQMGAVDPPRPEPRSPRRGGGVRG